MRLFIALDIDDAIRDGVARFIEGVRGFAPDARWVQSASLHITLKFIGYKPDQELPEVKNALATVRAEACEIRVAEYGFFPTSKSARVFWLGIYAGPQLALLAHLIDAKIAALGVPGEEHAFSPHLTLARRAGGSGAPRKNKGDYPHRAFDPLQKQLAAMGPLDFGTMTPRHFFLYESRLSPSGSKYTKLSAFALT